MANIKVFVVGRRRRHPGDDNNSTFLRTAKLKSRNNLSQHEPSISFKKVSAFYMTMTMLWPTKAKHSVIQSFLEEDDFQLFQTMIILIN